MNKSKFLKKSLAAVLAVLMIAAMIPLSAAAAASAPKVYLDSQQIDFAGGASQSVTVDNNTPNLTWDSQAKTKLGAVDAKGNENEVDNSAGIANLPLSDYPVADDVYTVTLRLYEESEEGGWQENPAEYTLLVTVKEVDVDLDATIKEVTGIPEMVSYTITDDKITIIVPFDSGVPTVIAAALNTHADAVKIFVPSSKKVDGNNGTGVAYAVAPSKKVTVTAPNAEKEYDVEIKNQTGFATFSVPDQIGDAEIKDKVTNSGDPTVKVKVKKGTNFDKIVPTFTLGETVEKVTTFKGATSDGNTGDTEDDDEIDVVSGKTELKFDNSGSAKTFNVYLKGVTTPVKVKVTVEESDEAEGAELKSIQVGEKARATVTGKDVTVNMGVNTDYSVNVDIVVEASKGATVSIPSQAAATFTETTGIFATSNRPVDISGKKFTIRVVSEDEKTTNDYNITLVSASEVKTDLTDFSIKDTNDGKIYSATFNGLTGTINLPFSMKGGVTNGSGWTIYATPSAGATAFTNETPAKAIVNGTTTFDKLFDQTTSGPVDIANGGFVEYYDVRVAADDEALGSTNTTRTYSIKLVFAQPKTGNLLLSGTSAVGTNNLGEVNENNTYKTEIGKVNTDAGEKDAVKLTLPHSVVEGIGATPTSAPAKIFFKTLKVSPGARVFGFAGATAATTTTKVTAADEFKQLDETVLGAQKGIKKINFDKAAYDAYNTGTKVLATATAYTVYVVNEKTPITLGTTDIAALNTAVTNKNAKVYYVYAVKADPEKGSALTSIKSVVDGNVTAQLSGGKITIAVPATYALANGDAAPAATAENVFTLNFALSKLASAAEDTGEELLSDNGKDKTDGTKFFVQYDGNDPDTPHIIIHDGTNNNVAVDNFVVTSEDGANSTKYPVSVKVNPLQTGATIKSLKVGNSSASISGSTINLSLPFGTALNPIKLDITADKMAKVFINGNPYKATNNYSLNSDVTITVTSEDGKTTNVYTLKTTLGERFTDVPANAWFAEYVEKAVDAGIVLGQGNGTFNPYGNITREDFAMMTVRMLGVEVDENATVPFKDEASVSAYAKGAVAYCAANKILNGYEDGNFNPKATITREEAAKILAAALKLEVTGTTTFADNARIQSWAVPYVAACQKAGIFGGDEANRFNPQQKITRAETAKVMVDSLKIK